MLNGLQCRSPATMLVLSLLLSLLLLSTTLVVASSDQDERQTQIVVDTNFCRCEQNFENFYARRRLEERDLQKIFRRSFVDQDGFIVIDNVRVIPREQFPCSQGTLQQSGGGIMQQSSNPPPQSGGGGNFLTLRQRLQNGGGRKLEEEEFDDEDEDDLETEVAPVKKGRVRGSRTEDDSPDTRQLFLTLRDRLRGNSGMGMSMMSGSGMGMSMMMRSSRDDDLGDEKPDDRFYGRLRPRRFRNVRGYYYWRRSPLYVFACDEFLLPLPPTPAPGSPVNQPSAMPSISSMPNSGLPDSRMLPSSSPSREPSTMPSRSPNTVTETEISPAPSSKPSSTPSISSVPSELFASREPSSKPSSMPSSFPSDLLASREPSSMPSSFPSASLASREPSSVPSSFPSGLLASQEPSSMPSKIPTREPSSVPSRIPSQVPSISSNPSVSAVPSTSPSVSSVPTESAVPSTIPSRNPSSVPSGNPVSSPSSEPSPPTDDADAESLINDLLDDATSLVSDLRDDAISFSAASLIYEQPETVQGSLFGMVVAENEVERVKIPCLSPTDCNSDRQHPFCGYEKLSTEDPRFVCCAETLFGWCANQPLGAFCGEDELCASGNCSSEYRCVPEFGV